ncbi:MAG: phage head-tail connector protein [Ruminiclostridium sp.]
MVLGSSSVNSFIKRVGLKEDEADMEYIEILLESAQNAVCDIIGRDILPERLYDVAVELAVIDHNKRGSEGESSRSEGGISRSFEDLPPRMLERLKNYPRKARALLRR